ncbi:MAG: restriction endonuclease subunit S [Clostridia bacterium]
MKYRIGDLCRLIGSGGTPSRARKEFYENGKIRWLKTKELNDKNIYDTEEHITEEALKHSSAKIYPINTITMAMYGATVGKLGILKRKCSTNQACCNLVIDEDRADYRFLFYSLLMNRDKLIGLANGAAQQNLNVGIIKNFEIECFELAEQRAIANILSTLDEKIEVNNRINKALEEIAQAIFKHWFVDFEFPNEKGEPYKSSGGEMVESELGMIPKGWEVKPIEEILDFTISGEWGKENKDIKHTQKIFCIRGADFPDLENGNRADVPIRFIKEGSFKKRKLEDGDIILEISGGTKGRPTGRTIYIHEDMIMNYSNRLSFSNFCRLMRTNYALDSKILYYYLQFLYNSGVMETYQVQSTGISNFQFSYFIANEYIIIPNKKVQKAFSGIVESFLNKRNTYEKHRLSQIRNTLLPKLMSGEIRVPIKSGGEVS